MLYEGEEIQLDLRPHWFYLAKTTLLLVAAVLFGILALALTWGSSNGIILPLRLVVAAVVVVALVSFLRVYLGWYNTNFVLTTDRLIFRVGVVAKKGIEIPLERINTVFFNQTVFERLWGTGDLSIESGGESGRETFSHVRHPHVVQNEIYKMMEDNQGRMFGTGKYATAAKAAAAPSEPTIPEQLERLYELAQRRVITEAEYEAKKTELLKRL
jgi:uncharacterized membrane protein YdbT with pleckstrin-like domain